jgi:DNA-binding transcriptional ArsR family regulator
MSGKLIGWAMKQVTGSPVTKLVLVKLADNANENGFCCASLELIVKHTELSDRAVRKHLYDLEDRGLVTIERRKVDGVQLRNLYHLNISDDDLEVPRAKVWHDVPADDLNEVPQGRARRANRVLHDVPAKKDNPQEEPLTQPSSDAQLRVTGEGDASPVSEEQRPPHRTSRKYSDAFERFWTEVRKWPEFTTIWAKTEAWRVWRELEQAGGLLKPGDMVAAAREYGRERARLNAEAKAERKTPQHTKHPANWLRERKFQGVHEALEDAAADASPPALLTISDPDVGVLRGIGIGDADIAAYFGDGAFLRSSPDAPPHAFQTTMVTKQRTIEGRWAERIARAFGVMRLDITLSVKQERAA